MVGRLKVCCWKLGVSCLNCWWMKSGSSGGIAGFLSYASSSVRGGRNDTVKGRVEVSEPIGRKERRTVWLEATMEAV